MTRVAVAVVLLQLVIAQQATADLETHRDARDNGRLDLRAGTHGHDTPASDGALRLRHEIATQGRWSRRDIRCRFNGCSWSLRIQFDTKGGPDYERVLYIFSQRGRGMEAEMFRHTDNNEDCESPRVACGNNGYLGRVGVWREDRSSVVVRFKKRLLGWHLDRYGWRAISTYDEPKGGCTDVREKDVSGSESAILTSPVPAFCVDYLPGRRTYVSHDEL